MIYCAVELFWLCQPPGDFKIYTPQNMKPSWSTNSRLCSVYKYWWHFSSWLDLDEPSYKHSCFAFYGLDRDLSFGLLMQVITAEFKWYDIIFLWLFFSPDLGGIGWSERENMFISNNCMLYDSSAYCFISMGGYAAVEILNFEFDKLEVYMAVMCIFTFLIWMIY